jgi:hypothetical protein
MANPMYGQNKADSNIDSASNELHKLQVKSDSVLLAVTHSVNYDMQITQPAGTYLKDIILTNSSAVVTNGSAGNGLDISMGVAASYTDLIAASELLDDNGGAVTWAANTPLKVVHDGIGHAAQAFVNTAVTAAGVIGGPATSEAIAVLLTPYSATDRVINIRLTPLTGNLTTAAATITASCYFQSV